ncbi:alpha/beta hydrolase [Rhodovulum sp. DZ06]|uniref:alpha/beta hydrolase n=1 Tax=Rhodovulum sp. DZ06 TaxID=3425126 RepID=UPI003D350443
MLGICGGGGYALNAALTEKRIKAVVGIAPVNLGRLFRESFSGFDPLGALQAMAAQRTAEARGGALRVDELLPASPAEAAGLTDRDVAEATEHCKTRRGAQPGGATRMLFSHAQKALSWDAFAYAEMLMTQPMMVVIGRKVGAFGACRDGSEIYGRATASADRRMVELEDGSHDDLYDRPEPVGQAMAEIGPFLKRHLAAA